MLLFLGVLSFAIGIVASVAAVLLGAKLWLAAVVFVAAGWASALIFVLVMFGVRALTPSGPNDNEEPEKLEREREQMVPAVGRHKLKD